jgi:hypothetical protein
MKRIASLIAVMAAPALLLFGCGGGYETSSGFMAGDVNISGNYQVAQKDPGVMPGLYSMQITHSGKSMHALDNLGNTWSGTISEFALYGVQPEQEQATDPTQQAQQQQQQQQTTESYHAEVYLTMQTGAGTNSLTGVMDTYQQLSLGVDPTQQQQQTTPRTTAISGTIVDSKGNSGYILLYNTIGQEDTSQQQTP